MGSILIVIYLEYMHEMIETEQVQVLPLLELINHGFCNQLADISTHKRPGRNVFCTPHPKALCLCLEDL